MSEPVDEVVRRLGGLATRSQLLRLVPRARLERALADGFVLRQGRSRITVPEVGAGVAAALRLDGAMCLTTAALHHGWGVASVPRTPFVVVPRTRKVDPRRRAGVALKWWDVEVDGIATSPSQTVVDCIRHLPLVDAVCVGDSALRSGLVSRSDLRAAAAGCPRNGRSTALHVVERLDGRAANPFESALRVLTWQVPGLQVEPQVHVAHYGRADLADRAKRLMLEGDSFTYHSSRAALLSDIERYNRAALIDHTLVRFGFEHVFGTPDYVVQTLDEWVRSR